LSISLKVELHEREKKPCPSPDSNSGRRVRIIIIIIIIINWIRDMWIRRKWSVIKYLIYSEYSSFLPFLLYYLLFLSFMVEDSQRAIFSSSVDLIPLNKCALQDSQHRICFVSTTTIGILFT
jgi:hypothetical protein